jgi:hypothetical protein
MRCLLIYIPKELINEQATKKLVARRFIGAFNGVPQGYFCKTFAASGAK